MTVCYFKDSEEPANMKAINVAGFFSWSCVVIDRIKMKKNVYYLSEGRATDSCCNAN